MAKTVGGGVRAEIELLDDEEVVWSKSAQRQGSPVATGGKLFLTDRRLLWTPNWYFDRLGADTIAISLTAVADVDVEEGRFGGVFASFLLGASDARLRVQTEDGRVETWASSASEEAAERIQASTSAPEP